MNYLYSFNLDGRSGPSGALIRTLCKRRTRQRPIKPDGMDPKEKKKKKNLILPRENSKPDSYDPPTSIKKSPLAFWPSSARKTGRSGGRNWRRRPKGGFSRIRAVCLWDGGGSATAEEVRAGRALTRRKGTALTWFGGLVGPAGSNRGGCLRRGV